MHIIRAYHVHGNTTGCLLRLFLKLALLSDPDLQLHPHSVQCTWKYYRKQCVLGNTQEDFESVPAAVVFPNIYYPERCMRRCNWVQQIGDLAAKFI